MYIKQIIENGECRDTLYRKSWVDYLSVHPNPDLDVNVYPNPVDDVLFIKVSPNAEVQTIRLFAANGQLLETLSMSNASRGQIATHSLPKGIYTLQVVGENGVQNLKVVKQ